MLFLHDVTSHTDPDLGTRRWVREPDRREMFLLTTLVMMCKKSDEIIKATKMGLLGKSYDVSAFILGINFYSTGIRISVDTSDLFLVLLTAVYSCRLSLLTYSYTLQRKEFLLRFIYQLYWYTLQLYTGRGGRFDGQM